MSRAKFSPPGGDYPGATMIAELQAALDAILSTHSGEFAPSYAAEGLIIIRQVSASEWRLQVYDGANWHTIATVNPVANTISLPLGAIGIGDVTGLQTALDAKAAASHGHAAADITDLATVLAGYLPSSGIASGQHLDLTGYIQFDGDDTKRVFGWSNNENDFSANRAMRCSDAQAAIAAAVGAAGGGGLRSVQVFTSSGTWTRPSGIGLVRVTVTGGGAGGGINESVGGGGGATAIKLIDVSLISSATITVGAGGGRETSNGPGGNGSDSVWNDGTNIVTGGRGLNTRAGGVATGGDINIPGVSGGEGPGGASGGDGGGSFWGQGGIGGSDISSFDGNDAQAFGAGGSGGDDTSGRGADGIVVVEEFAA